MELAFAAFAFAPGLALGSFLNVVAARVPLRRSIVTAALGLHVLRRRRSRGTTTSRSSRALLLRGRCRSCGASIACALPGRRARDGAADRRLRPALRSHLATRSIASFFCAALVAISAIDLEHRIIPNRIVLPAAAIVLVAQTLVDPSLEWALAGLRRLRLPLRLRRSPTRRAWAWAT